MKWRSLRTAQTILEQLWWCCVSEVHANSDEDNHLDNIPKAENWWNDEIFYEVFVRSFYDTDGNGRGDFQGLIEKLDYLNDGARTLLPT